ncbi:DUF1801 domain-containing protein [Microcella daejeonensis]|uniref:DUF1801 domain-containing protein n=1 Tax=Microcella daejeonensis TaxID=2994971 RepID=A0A9E8MKG4_9MICO|nr:DUF1801 domain-containing protein [Microcella daejeonensis]WAB80431.1 DUF1801 domain-containing protein [Microcella daejeonensis]
MSAVDDYIARFPADVQPILRAVRAAIHAGVPEASEQIRYGMPAVMLDGRYALHFAGWKNHVGLYPVPRGDEEFESLIGSYRSATDTVTLLYSKPLPVGLITRIAQECVAQRGDQHGD